MTAGYRSILAWLMAAWLPATAIAVAVCRRWDDSAAMSAVFGSVAALVVMLITGALVSRAGKTQPARAAQMFVLSAVGRTIAAVGLAAAAWAALGLSVRPLMLGVLAGYLATLVAESVYLTRTLKAHQEALQKKPNG